MTDLILMAVAVHLFVDWFLQNDFMAANKMKWVAVTDPVCPNPYCHNVNCRYNRPLRLPHPAGLIHAGLHGLAMLLVFPWWAALTVGVAHWFIDLRFPLIWWRKTFRMTTDTANPAAMHVAIWQDQVAHVLVIFVVGIFV